MFIISNNYTMHSIFMYLELLLESGLCYIMIHLTLSLKWNNILRNVT